MGAVVVLNDFFPPHRHTVIDVVHNCMVFYNLRVVPLTP